MFTPDAQTQGLSPTLTPFMAFWWGAGGSLAIEILSLYNEIRASNASGLPAYYKNPLFWFVRLRVTAIAGISHCGRSSQAFARDQYWRVRTGNTSVVDKAFRSCKW